MKPITELKNIHKGKEIWVVCSGSSLNHVAPRFFSGRITIGVNDVWKKFPCTYYIRKDELHIEDSAHPLIVPEYKSAGYNFGKHVYGDYVFQHRDTAIEVHNHTEHLEHEDWLVTCSSTTPSAIHLAAYMGASIIMLAGHDCGTLDGNIHISEYKEPDREWYLNWLFRIERESLQTRDWVEDKYGCLIYSLNPFLNLGLEGHTYKGCRNDL